MKKLEALSRRIAGFEGLGVEDAGEYVDVEVYLFAKKIESSLPVVKGVSVHYLASLPVVL